MTSRLPRSGLTPTSAQSGNRLRWAVGLGVVDPEVMVSDKYYREVLLKRDLLPDIRELSDYWTFQPDNAPDYSL